MAKYIDNDTRRVFEMSKSGFERHLSRVKSENGKLRYSMFDGKKKAPSAVKQNQVAKAINSEMESMTVAELKAWMEKETEASKIQSLLADPRVTVQKMARQKLDALAAEKTGGSDE